MTHSFTRRPVYFYHQDELGSVVRITNSSGVVVNTYDYDDYGNIISQTENITNDYTYTGKERDKDSGLYYYGARYYDPEIGRWLTKDIIPAINRYLYVENNPIGFIDIWGFEAATLPDGPEGTLAGVGLSFILLGGSAIFLAGGIGIPQISVPLTAGGLIAIGAGAAIMVAAGIVAAKKGKGSGAGSGGTGDGSGKGSGSGAGPGAGAGGGSGGGSGGGAGGGSGGGPAPSPPAGPSSNPNVAML